MKKFRKLLIAVIAVTMLTAFTDVPKTHWAYSYINEAQSLGLVQGSTKKIFDPNSTITKQEMAYLFINLYKLTNTVDDVYVDECVSSSAITLKQAGISAWAQKGLALGFVNEYWKLDDFKAPFNGKTGGNAPMSRQMMSRWIFNVMGYKNFGLRVLPYLDNKDIDPAYYPYIDSLYKYGVMVGGSGLFEPNGVLDRAQSAAVALKIYKENTAENSNIEKNPFVYESGVVSNINEKYKSFNLGDKLLQIADDAKIILDGNLASFSDIAALNGKTLVASQYLNGSNTNTFVLQTKPTICSGTIVELVKTSIPGGSSYTMASIDISGIRIDYVIDSNTDVLSNLTIGTSVQFTADGIYIQEIM